MRNICLSATTLEVLARDQGGISATAIDLDSDTLYVASEYQTYDADVEVEISKIEGEKTIDVACQASVVAILTTAPSPPTSALQVVSFRILQETHTLALIMRGGDIAVLSLESTVPSFEIEGTVEPGIMAASWSPDDSLLVLVTAEAKLILMTATFDVLSETPLHKTEFGEDAPINVGWGTSQTQFHGSLGKAAAAKSAAQVTAGASPDDDALPRISWRGDGAFFVVSSLTPSSTSDTLRRVLRIYDRQAVLQSTSEAVPGLEHSLAWRPSGALIAGTQRFGSFEGGGIGKEGRHDVVFFERNGLRHGEFGIRSLEPNNLRKGNVEGNRRWGYRVRELSWNSNSFVLSVWIEGDDVDVVQLWTMGNYHWYLKQEISAPTSKKQNRFTSVMWHPEQPLQLILTTSNEVIQRTYAWDTFVSRCKPPNDSGCVAVLDGCMYFEHFSGPNRTQNVPPPMASYQLSLNPDFGTPIHASLKQDVFALLWDSGLFELWNLHTRIGPGRGKVMDPQKASSGFVRDAEFRQVLLWSDGGERELRLALLGSERSGADVVVFTSLGDEGREEGDGRAMKMSGRNGRLVESDKGVVWQARNGSLFTLDIVHGTVLPAGRFPEFCFASVCVSAQSGLTYVGLSDANKLYVCVASDSDPQTLATNATSFTIASGFVIFTSTAHEVNFVPFTALGSGDTKLWEKRRVERGSRIVTAVPSTMSLVLQMPRGNLETINPRPLVMEVVKRDIDAGNYRKAFSACRKHRIDLNVLVEHDPDAFLSRLSEFVDQVEDVDHINLFLSSLGRGSQPPETISRLCDAIRAELEKKDLNKYVNSVLTAYVVKSPPDHEAGLALLLHLRESNAQIVEEAVKYIIFLVDADRLFDTALGMYDFSLVLMIAQHAQKDPREYLPFLRELRAFSKYYQRFRIDDHLRRHEKALHNLSMAGSEYFEEAMTYVERHQLYGVALSIWKNTAQYHSVLNIYGDWLFERRDFKQAALVFVEAARTSKAMVAYEKALQWQELFDLALCEKTSEDSISTMAYRVAEDLLARKRFSEAARVLLDYGKDSREAIIALVQGNHFSEARRIVATLNGTSGLLAEIIYPGALESRAQLMEDINEMRDQLRKQVHRLQELRIKKVEEPESFYGVEDSNLQNVDVMTDISMPETAFTRYTVAPSAASKSSKRSSRSKRKMERKVGSGRKGTVDEEEYLLKSITKLVARFNTTQDDAGSLLPHLFQFTEEHRAEAALLQQDLSQFEQEIREALAEVWVKPTGTPTDAVPNSWATRMEEKESVRHTNPTDRVPRPDIVEVEWRLKILHGDFQ